jgi:hypothetical protein
MNTDIRRGDRDRVVPAPEHRCMLHGTHAMVQAEGKIGVVDRLDDRFDDHPIVVFRGLRHPPFNDPWVEGFSPVELELA